MRVVFSGFSKTQPIAGFCFYSACFRFRFAGFAGFRAFRRVFSFRRPVLYLFLLVKTSKHKRLFNIATILFLLVNLRTYTIYRQLLKKSVLFSCFQLHFCSLNTLSQPYKSLSTGTKKLLKQPFQGFTGHFSTRFYIFHHFGKKSPYGVYTQLYLLKKAQLSGSGTDSVFTQNGDSTV